MFDYDFSQQIIPDLYHKFVEWAKVPNPVVQVTLADGRHFWVNRVVTSEQVSQAATFFQEVTEGYCVAFVVPYERIAYVVPHCDIPPEYRKIPVRKRPRIGFRVNTESAETE